MNGNNSSIVAAEFAMAPGGVLKKPICISASNVTLDCGGKWIDGAGVPAPWGNNDLHAGVTIIGNVEWINVLHCKVKNFNKGVLVRTNPGDLSLLSFAYWNNANTAAIEDGIRATQARHIWIDNLETTGVTNGLYVLNYATDVNLSWSTIRASGVGVYLDSGSQYNVIRDTHFVTSGSNREAIAVDASAYNQIIRNQFEGGWTSGVDLYKNCGEQWWAPPRPQPAMWNEIKYNTFVGLPFGVRVASRADKKFDNWRQNNPYETPNQSDVDGWKCADRTYYRPDDSGEVVNAVDFTNLPYRVDHIYQRAYYRDRAPNNIVRCNYFWDNLSAVNVFDDHVLVEGNRITQVRLLAASNIRVGSDIRNRKNEPVSNVNVVNNVGQRLSCAFGAQCSANPGLNWDWGEPDGCTECPAGRSTCPPGMSGGTPVTRPIGWIDSATRTTVCGWALDLDHPNDPINVHVYVDGANGVAGTTSTYRADVNARYRVTGNHGFCIPVNISSGVHSVVAYGIDPDGQGNPPLNGSPKVVGDELMVGDIVNNTSRMYSVASGNLVSDVGVVGRNTCPTGYSHIGYYASASGFWLCARSDLASRAFYFGDVEANNGTHYKVQSGAITYLGAAGWDTCNDGSTFLGRWFTVNGFWACMK